jgi:hypothetical protein
MLRMRVHLSRRARHDDVLLWFNYISGIFMLAIHISRWARADNQAVVVVVRIHDRHFYSVLGGDSLSKTDQDE